MQYVMKKFNLLSSIELHAILKLRQDVFIIEQACIYPDIDGHDEGAYHLMAFDRTGVVGCLRVLEQGVTFDEFSIGRVAVAQEHRRKGIAKEMMLQAIDFIGRNRKGTRIKISAQTYALPFYQQLGFVSAGDEYLEDDIWHVDMVCALDGRVVL